MESLRLDRKGIQEYQRNRDPYLLINFAEEVIPGVSALADESVPNQIERL